MSARHVLLDVRAAVAKGHSIISALDVALVDEALLAETFLARAAGVPCLHGWLLRMSTKSNIDTPGLELIRRNMMVGVTCLDAVGDSDEEESARELRDRVNADPLAAVRLVNKAIDYAKKAGL